MKNSQSNDYSMNFPKKATNTEIASYINQELLQIETQAQELEKRKQRLLQQLAEKQNEKQKDEMEQKRKEEIKIRQKTLSDIKNKNYDSSSIYNLSRNQYEKVDHEPFNMKEDSNFSMEGFKSQYHGDRLKQTYSTFDDYKLARQLQEEEEMKQINRLRGLDVDSESEADKPNPQLAESLMSQSLTFQTKKLREKEEMDEKQVQDLLFKFFNINETFQKDIKNLDDLNENQKIRLCNYFGLKSGKSNLKASLSHLKEIQWFLLRNKLPPNYMEGYDRFQMEKKLEIDLTQSNVTPFGYKR